MKGSKIIDKIDPESEYLPTRKAFRFLVIDNPSAFKSKMAKTELKRLRHRLKHGEPVSVEKMSNTIGWHGKNAGITFTGIYGLYKIEKI